MNKTKKRATNVKNQWCKIMLQTENNVNTYLIDTYVMPYFDEYLNVVVYTAL